ncbi:hypothetical protein [Synechococcus sp. CS-1328]|uniref:hypothetical protein n=1 Tax=Synechococcus sp. CS-1328 TaxID=2847976 RepID=UPI00223AF224|nr:hypothetical protein [Synechococcus sp. CS-1328]MCT0225276.1 hypothetical protein [Synechococcus sp. CS-1328]
MPPSPDPSSTRAVTLARFAVRCLRIGASSVALVALVRQQWIGAACFAAAWLLTLQAQRWLPEPLEAQPPNG